MIAPFIGRPKAAVNANKCRFYLAGLPHYYSFVTLLRIEIKLFRQL